MINGEGGLKGYLKFMEPRLEECRRLLKDTGSLYLHCDPTASHYLKVMLDGVFGMKQFRNEIVWCYRRSTHSSSRNFGKCHDVFLYYSKTNEWIFNADEVRIPYQPASIQRFKYRMTTSFKTTGKPNSKGKFPEDWFIQSFLGSGSKERLAYPTQKTDRLIPTHDQSK